MRQREWKTTDVRRCSAERFQYGRSTCWTLAWFWSRIWSRAAERAGLANSGIAGAAPRRPGQEKKHQNPQLQKKSPTLQRFFRVLTLLVSRYHRVKQHL